MKGWKKKLLFSLLGILGLFVLLYFILTSQAFIKSQILPRISKAIDAPVTAKSISFSPFSAIELHNLEIGAGESQMLYAKTVRCRYSLMSLLLHDLIINELILDGVKINIVQDTDSKSKQPQSPQKKSKTVSPAPMEGGFIAGFSYRPKLKNIHVSDFSLLIRSPGKNSQPPLLFELKDFKLNIPEFRLDQSAKLDFHGNIRFSRGNEVNLENATLTGKLSAEISSKIKMRNILLEIRLNELAGHFQKIDLARHSIALILNMTGNGNTFNLQELRFTEDNAGQAEAALLISGNGTINPRTAKLNIAVNPVTASALNLVGAVAGGLDFGKTSINYQGQVNFQDGQQLEANGKLKVLNAIINSPSMKSPCPPMDINMNHSESFDLKTRLLKIRNWNLLAKNDKQTVTQLSVKGNIFSPPVKSESVLEINSEFFDTQPLISFFSPLKSASGQKPAENKPAPKTDKDSPIFPTKEPPAADLKGLWLTVHLNFAQIRHGKILISPLKSLIRVRDNKVDIQPLDLVLNQTPFHCRANADLNKPGYTYAVHCDMGALNLDPIISASMPEEYRDCISGSIKGFNLDAKGAGITGLNLSRHSDIHFRLDIGTLSLKNLPYQETASSILLIPEINRILFNDGGICLNTSGNGLEIDGTQLSGPDFCITGKGLIGFNENLNLKFIPGVGGSLGEKVAILPTALIFNDRKGNYMMAPSLTYPLTGTLRHPQTPNWEEILTNSINGVLNKNVGKTIFDAARQLMKKGKKNTKDILRNLNLPTQESTQEKSTQPPQAEPKKENLPDDLIKTGSDLFKGIFEGK